MRAAGEAKQWAEATQDAMEKAALAQLRGQWNRSPGLLATKMVDMGVQISLVIDFSIEASRLENGKALVGFPLPVVKGTRSRSIRRSCGPYGGLSKVPRKEIFVWRAKGEGGAGEEVGPEGEDEKGGEGAQRRACE